jgi:hypothetical protein
MRWNTDMSKEEVYSALVREAKETWGIEQLEALDSSLKAAADALWNLMQVHLMPLSEEPDLSTLQSIADWKR